MRPEYFRAYYDAAFGTDYAISIIRADGAMLARYPDVRPGIVLSPETGFRPAIAANPERGGYTAVSAAHANQPLFSYGKRGSFPPYLARCLASATVARRRWHH